MAKTSFFANNSAAHFPYSFRQKLPHQFPRAGFSSPKHVAIILSNFSNEAINFASPYLIKHVSAKQSNLATRQSPDISRFPDTRKITARFHQTFSASTTSVAHPPLPHANNETDFPAPSARPHFPSALKQFATNAAPAHGLRRSLSTSDRSPHKISKFMGFRITGGKFSPVLSRTGSFGHHW
jgi:hypothetical protein